MTETVPSAVWILVNILLVVWSMIWLSIPCKHLSGATMIYVAQRELIKNTKSVWRRHPPIASAQTSRSRGARQHCALRGHVPLPLFTQESTLFEHAVILRVYLQTILRNHIHAYPSYLSGPKCQKIMNQSAKREGEINLTIVGSLKRMFTSILKCTTGLFTLIE